jgi:hypothetical protein
MQTDEPVKVSSIHHHLITTSSDTDNYLFPQDAQATRFLFMYSGEKLDIDHFKGKFDISSIQGTVDERGYHHVFLHTVDRYRVSQFASAIDKFNQSVPDTRAMRLQKEPFQPAIVTMTVKKMEGRIYFKIMEDIQKKRDGERSEYWDWKKTGVGSTMQQQALFLQRQEDEQQQEILNNKRMRHDGEGAATSSESVVEAGEPQPASLSRQEAWAAERTELMQKEAALEEKVSSLKVLQIVLCGVFCEI